MAIYRSGDETIDKTHLYINIKNINKIDKIIYYIYIICNFMKMVYFNI